MNFWTIFVAYRAREFWPKFVHSGVFSFQINLIVVFLRIPENCLACCGNIHCHMMFWIGRVGTGGHAAHRAPGSADLPAAAQPVARAAGVRVGHVPGTPGPDGQHQPPWRRAAAQVVRHDRHQPPRLNAQFTATNRQHLDKRPNSRCPQTRTCGVFSARANWHEKHSPVTYFLFCSGPISLLSSVWGWRETT